MTVLKIVTVHIIKVGRKQIVQPQKAARFDFNTYLWMCSSWKCYFGVNLQQRKVPISHIQ